MTKHTEEAIQQKTVLEVTWTNCPEDVKTQVRDLWAIAELGNDNYYYQWNSDSDGEDYPVIDAYLKSKGVLTCLIHWWW